MQHGSLHCSGLAHLLQSPEANTLNLTVLRRIDPTISQVLVRSMSCCTILLMSLDASGCKGEGHATGVPYKAAPN